MHGVELRVLPRIRICSDLHMVLLPLFGLIRHLAISGILGALIQSLLLASPANTTLGTAIRGLKSLLVDMTYAFDADSLVMRADAMLSVARIPSVSILLAVLDDDLAQVCKMVLRENSCSLSLNFIMSKSSSSMLNITCRLERVLHA